MGSGRELDVDRLVLAVRAGDREAFGAIVAAIHAEVRCAIAARADSAELVDEIAQRAFVTAFQRIDQYRGPGFFAAWVKAIARHHLHDEWSARRRMAALDGDAVGEALAALEADGDPAEDEVEAARLARLGRCLSRLPPQSRRLIELRYVRDCSLNEIAQRSRRSADAVAMALSRLRAALRRCIEART